ncbi:hypothetical protein CPC08DRAFT_714683 [Agrocybe pediades]|nr:hypothetical protein CPC08DRAFT_714683 [Agrocybe pediades]
MVKSTAQGGLESLSVNMGNASVSVPAADFQAVAGIIKNSAKSLKTLDITVSTDLPVHLLHDEAIFNVATVPFLEEISLTGAVIHSETRQNNCPINLHWLSRHLETIPISGKKFKKISLHSIIMDGTLVFEEDFDDEGLKWFENLVLNVALPQTLSLSVKFTIYANMHDTQTAETLIKKHLSGLHAQNLLEFDAKVQSDEEYLLELAEDFVRYEMSDSDSSF